MRKLAAILLVFSLAACTPEQKQLWCTTIKAVSVVKSTVGVALPFLSPGLSAQWRNLSEGMDFAMAPLLSACADGAKASQVQAAIDASLNLLEWYRANRTDIEAATPNRMGLMASEEVEVEKVIAKLKKYQQR